MKVLNLYIVTIILSFTIWAFLPAQSIDVQEKNLFYKETTLKGMASINEPFTKDTKLKISINEEIDSNINQVGDKITATILNDLSINDFNLIPVGSYVVGHIEDIKHAGKVSMQATVDISLDRIILPDGKYISLTGAKLAADSKHTNLKRNLKGSGDGFAKSVGVGFVKGATLTFIPGNAAVKTTAVGVAATGAVLSGGWSIGSTATIGGLTGLYYGLKRNGQEVMIASGHELEIVLDENQDLTTIEVAVDDLMNQPAETTTDGGAIIK